MGRDVRLQIETEGRAIYIAFRDRASGAAVTVRVARGQAGAMAAALCSAASDGALESYEMILHGDLTVSPGAP